MDSCQVSLISNSLKDGEKKMREGDGFREVEESGY